MEKVKFEKEEVLNLMSMFKSTDQSNAELAFQIVENSFSKESEGEVILLYKYSGRTAGEWEKHAPKVYNFVKEHLQGNNNLSAPRTLTIMSNIKASNSSVELFMEVFTNELKGYMQQLGFETEKFELTIKLK
jgi:hypothetical protein